MFVRVKRSGSGERKHEYLQIVESVRTHGSVRQRVVATLGRRDQLVVGGALDALLQSLAKFSEKLRVVQRVRSEGIEAHWARSWGPALVFERLWQAQRLPEILSTLSKGRRFAFDIERACFALARQRLCAPGSDLQGSQWLRTVECPAKGLSCAVRWSARSRSCPESRFRQIQDIRLCVTVIGHDDVYAQRARLADRRGFDPFRRERHGR